MAIPSGAYGGLNKNEPKKLYDIIKVEGRNVIYTSQTQEKYKISEMKVY